MLQQQYEPLEVSDSALKYQSNKYKKYHYFKTFAYSCFILFTMGQSISLASVTFFNGILMIINLYFRNRFLRPDFAILALSPLLGFIFGYKLQIIGLSFLTFTYPFAIKFMYQCFRVLRKVKNLVITMIFIFCLFAYLTTLLFKDLANTKKYFQNFGWSNLTMLQIMTLDAWGEVGRALDFESKSKGGAPILICFFIFLMSYFYMNILVGLVLETLQKQNGHKDSQDSPFSPSKRQVSQKRIDNLLLGNHYQIFIFACSFITVTSITYHGFSHFDMDLEVFIGLLDDILYTTHFIFLLFKRGQMYAFERQSKLMMIVHFLSGPFSLFIAITYDQILGSLLNLLKLATTPIIKGIFKGTFHIIPLLLAPTIIILGGTLLISAVFTLNYHEYLGSNGQQYFFSVWKSFYTFFQILTLDDWRAQILPAFQDKVLAPNIVFPMYIFFSNFVLLNSLIALSCQYFIEIESVTQHHQDQQVIKTDNQNDYLLQQFEQKHGKIPKIQLQNLIFSLSNQENILLQDVMQGRISEIKIIYKNKEYHSKVLVTVNDTEQEIICQQ